MKNLFLGTALCALVVTGCSKLDEAEAVQPEQGKVIDVTINATRYTTPSTRTAYEEGANALIVKWNSDKSDQLGVFTKGNGTVINAQFSVSDELLADGKVANFTGSLTLTDPEQETTVYSYYPYSGNAGSEPAAVAIDLSSQKQSGMTGQTSLAHLAAKDYLAATPVTNKFGDGDQVLSLTFNPLLTILSFEIDKNINVKSITLKAVGDNKTPFYTTGTVDITTADNSFPITPSGTATNAISLEVDNSKPIGPGKDAKFSMMIFPIGSSEMPAQFKVTVTTTDGTVYTQTKIAPANGFVRGERSIMELRDLTEGTWAGEGIEANPYQIATAEDLVRLSSQVNKGMNASGKYFKLMNDIDLGNTEWIPIGTSDYYFEGSFDGNKKVISGMKITTPKELVGLFGFVSGNATIKDITVAGEINISTDLSRLFAGGILGFCEGEGVTLSGISTNH